MPLRQSVGAISLLTIASCCPVSVPVTSGPVYTPPEASGLVGVRPFPKPNDVCQVIGENAQTAEYLDHTRLLIGCPVHEMGAIGDRMADGAERLTQIGDWVLLSLPIG